MTDERADATLPESPCDVMNLVPAIIIMITAIIPATIESKSNIVLRVLLTEGSVSDATVQSSMPVRPSQTKLDWALAGANGNRKKIPKNAAMTANFLNILMVLLTST